MVLYLRPNKKLSGMNPLDRRKVAQALFDFERGIVKKLGNNAEKEARWGNV